jgi:hypothetical protein
VKSEEFATALQYLTIFCKKAGERREDNGKE